MVSMTYEYETFIRRAFSINRSLINKYQDPAGLADADRFTEEVYSIEEVKAAVSYSMQIFKKHIVENNKLSKDEIQNINSIIKNVIDATDKIEIYNLIIRFKIYEDKYVNNV